LNHRLFSESVKLLNHSLSRKHQQKSKRLMITCQALTQKVTCKLLTQCKYQQYPSLRSKRKKQPRRELVKRQKLCSSNK